MTDACYITHNIFLSQITFSGSLLHRREFMNYDLVVLVSKLRHVENLEQLQEVKELADTFLRREKITLF